MVGRFSAAALSKKLKSRMVSKMIASDGGRARMPLAGRCGPQHGPNMAAATFECGSIDRATTTARRSPGGALLGASCGLVGDPCLVEGAMVLPNSPGKGRAKHYGEVRECFGAAFDCSSNGSQDLLTSILLPPLAEVKPSIWLNCTIYQHSNAGRFGYHINSQSRRRQTFTLAALQYSSAFESQALRRPREFTNETSSTLYPG